MKRAKPARKPAAPPAPTLPPEPPMPPPAWLARFTRDTRSSFDRSDVLAGLLRFGEGWVPSTNTEIPPCAS